MELDLDWGFWIKFFILFIPLSIAIFVWSPTLKWKLLYQPAIAFAIFIALKGYALNPNKLRRR